VSHTWDEIRRLMWSTSASCADRRLERAARRFGLIREEIRDYYWKVLVIGDLLELRNNALVADLIVESPRRRPESRGLHYTLDHPDHNPRPVRDTVLARGDGPGIWSEPSEGSAPPAMGSGAGPAFAPRAPGRSRSTRVPPMDTSPPCPWCRRHTRNQS
jgi:hypothetical protein